MLKKLRGKTKAELATLPDNPQLITISMKAGRKQQRRQDHQLPHDVLIVIFEEACRQTSPLDNNSDRSWVYRYIDLPSSPNHDRCFVTLMRLTQICYYWREVAVGTALLWNRINLPCRDAKLLELHIERSRNTSLDVSVHYFQDENLNAEFDAFLLQHMHRIRRLYIDICHRITLILPECNAPYLTGLYVKAHVWPLHSTPVQILTHTPNLRKISFRSVKPTIPSSNLSSITHLYLTNPFTTSEDTYIQYPKLMDMLSHCQALVEMDVDFNSHEATPLDVTYRIDFPNLQFLRLRNLTHHPSYYPLSHFKAHVLRALYIYNKINTFPPASVLLPTSLVDLASLNVQAARITHRGGQSPLSFRLYSDLGFVNEVFMCVQGTPSEILRHFFLEVIRSHGLTSIESLHIKFYQGDGYSTLEHDLDFHYVKSLPNIRSIHIEGIRFTDSNSLGSQFFKTITSSGTQSQGRQHDTLFLPKLEKLTVTHKTSDRIFPTVTPAVKKTVLACDDLVHFLRYRVQHKSALKELYIHWKAVEDGWSSWKTQEIASFVGTLQFFD